MARSLTSLNDETLSCILTELLPHLKEQGIALINASAISMGLLGFIPGYVVSWILKQCGILRVSDAVQQAGVDSEVPVSAYPEALQSRDYS